MLYNMTTMDHVEKIVRLNPSTHFRKRRFIVDAHLQSGAGLLNLYRHLMQFDALVTHVEHLSSQGIHYFANS